MVENQKQEIVKYVTDYKFVEEYTSNVKSNLIEITEDKLENILLKYLNQLNTNKMWITPLSLFLTIILVITTASFNDTLGITKDIWAAIFYLSAVGSFIWFIYSIKKINNKMSIEDLISKIKNKK